MPMPALLRNLHVVREVHSRAATSAAMSAPLYSVRPTFKEKFPPSEVKKIIGSYLHEFLADKTCALPAASSGRVLASAAAAHAYA